MVDVIVGIESRFPVDRWTIAGVHVWPLIRIRLYDALTDQAGRASEATVPPVRSSWDVFSGRERNAVRRLARRFVSAVRRPRSSMRARIAGKRLATHYDALFYSLTHMRTRIDGVWYDRHCDPLIDILQAESGQRVLLLESAYELGHRRPRAHESSVIDIDTWLTRTAGKAEAISSPERTLDGFPEFAEWLRAEFPETRGHDISVASVERDVASLISLEKAFERVLSDSRPRACFVVCYYHVPAMALIWASRRLGIPSVDLQHGMQAGPPYARWTKVPPGGFETLPEIFWNWNASDAEGIREWSEASGSPHRAVVGGYPWLDRFLTTGASTTNGVMPPLATDSKRPLRILFSMPTFSYDLPSWVVSAIRASPPEWEWWFRLHPRQLQARAGLERVLRDDDSTVRFEIESATARPLPLVLQDVDVHVTHSSAVTIEAEYFGVRTVALSPDTARSFANQANAGTLVVATDALSLVDAIRWQADGRTYPAIGGAGKGRQTRETLAALLAAQ